MRLKILLLIFFTDASLSVYASNQTETMDTSRVEVVYKYSVVDPKKDKSEEWVDLLQCGQHYSKSMCYNSFLIDSILNAPLSPTDGIEKTLQYLVNKYKGRTAYLLINEDASQYISSNSIAMTRYVYEEPEPEYAWEILDSTDTICGYECVKARCKFRGREWTVWYTEEIPLSRGPWKLRGLPGMILRADDSTWTQHWEAFAIREASNPITRQTSDDITTTRERYNRLEREYKNDPIGTLQRNGTISKIINAKGEPSKNRGNSLFYNPPELE